MFKVQWARQTKKDYENIKRAKLEPEIADILKTVRQNPFDPAHHFEELKNNMRGMYSRRIDYRHRFVYKVLPNTENILDNNGNPYEGIVRITNTWGHY